MAEKTELTWQKLQLFRSKIAKIDTELTAFPNFQFIVREWEILSMYFFIVNNSSHHRPLTTHSGTQFGFDNDFLEKMVFRGRLVTRSVC